MGRVVTYSVLVLFGLLFVEFTNQSRVFLQFLDMGHFVLFAFLILLVLNLRSTRSKHWLFQLVFPEPLVSLTGGNCKSGNPGWVRYPGFRGNYRASLRPSQIPGPDTGP